MPNFLKLPFFLKFHDFFSENLNYISRSRKKNEVIYLIGEQSSDFFSRKIRRLIFIPAGASDGGANSNGNGEISSIVTVKIGLCDMLNQGVDAFDLAKSSSSVKA